MTKKVTHALIAMLMLAVLFQRCTPDDEESTAVEKVQFSLDFTLPDGANGRIKASDIPTGAHVLLSVEKSNGEIALTQQPVKVLAFGESYITEPLALHPGQYRVTDFLLVDENSEVLYAAPKKGSPLAEAVKQPLPYTFYISRNKVSNIDMQVLDVSEHMPEQFGYVSFNLKAGAAFQLAVFVNEDGKTKLTDAHAYILNGTDTLQHFDLKARVNTLFFSGDRDANYTLVVTKAGYATDTREFNFNQLDNKPLQVYLQAENSETKTLRLWYNPIVHPEEPPIVRFSMILGAEEQADITVNFGDGTIENYSIPAGSVVEAVHIFDTGNYVITVSGDVDKITSFEPYWESVVERIDFSDLTNLKEILAGPYGNIELASVDLRYNQKLELLSLSGFRLDTLLLPSTHFINNINVSGNPMLSTAEIDEIINNVYTNAVANNITGGYFNLTKSSGGMVGPPSADAIDKLRALRDTYGWTITPNP
jgi:hypothetical protein